MSTIITHLNPDLDAICSVWLLKRFMPGYEDAEVKFIPAGIAPVCGVRSTVYGNDGEELFVDTGFGKFDHHQTSKRICASKLVWDYIKKQSSSLSFQRKRGSIKIIDIDSRVKPENDIVYKAIERLTDVVLRIDYDAEDITMPHAADDFYSFLFNERQLLRGIRSLYRGQSDKHLEIGMTLFDAIFEVLKAKVAAEEVIENSIKFKTKWGKGLGSVNNNEMYMHLAQEMGCQVVVAKDPKRGHIRVHGLPNKKIDFTKAYEKLKKMDPDATWFLHSSKSLLLNGSSANPDMRPTKLTLEEVINVLKEN